MIWNFFYGFIHKDILEEYDFWGYGNNDLVYGNLEMLINDKMFEMYDVITTMSERIAGRFAIFRNNKSTDCFNSDVKNGKNICLQTII